MKILLDDADMDAQLSRTLVAVAAEACDLGEALATAGRVTPGDYDSWYAEWSATAEAAQAVADRSAEGGHTVTARKAYLRASEDACTRADRRACVDAILGRVGHREAIADVDDARAPVSCFISSRDCSVQSGCSRKSRPMT